MYLKKRDLKKKRNFKLVRFYSRAIAVELINERTVYDSPLHRICKCSYIKIKKVLKILIKETIAATSKRIRLKKNFKFFYVDFSMILRIETIDMTFKLS